MKCFFTLIFAILFSVSSYASLACRLPLESFTEQLKNFNSQSVFIFEPNISFNDSEVVEAKHYLRHIQDRQISLSIDNRKKTQANLDAGDIFLPDSFLLFRKTANALTYAEVAQKISPGILAGVSLFIKDLAEAYIQAQNKKPRLITGLSMLRATSNRVGHRVRGLHNHMSVSPQGAINFIWAIDGRGAVVMINGRLIHLREGQAAVFGNMVDHGSPDSESLRLIDTGHIVIK